MDLTDVSGLAQQFALQPRQFLGIPIALVGAVLLSFGAQYQHRGVQKVERLSGRAASSGLNLRQFARLLSRPSWVAGTLLLGLAIIVQLTSLTFSPLIVVQPLGVVALVVTAVLNSVYSKVRLNRASIRAVAMCVGGVVLFVAIAAFTATDRPVDDVQLLVILGILVVVAGGLGLAFAVLRHRGSAFFYIVGAGVLYGFVATLAKVVISRMQQGHFEWLTVLCLAGLVLAAVFGGYLVQTAYASGPPDLVIAGLTVIDPMVAVLIGIVVLGEAQFAPVWAVVAFIVTAALAVFGVFMLARHHPQMNGSLPHVLERQEPSDPSPRD